MRLFLIIMAVVIAGIAVLVLLRTPRTDRNWQAPLARAPQFTQIPDGAWTLDHLRTFEFGTEGPVFEGWRPTELNPNDLTEIWFFVEPFEDWDAAAHSFLSFVFEGDAPQTVSVSVEARKEEGETYSGIRGLFNAYELIYLWSTEKDILTRIAINLDHELYAYKLDVTPEQARAILDHFIARTNRLIERPRFYNTLTSNCTNELAKAVNEAFPGALPWHYSHILTGYSAERLNALNFIEADKPFKEFRASADIRAAVQAVQSIDAGEFSKHWRSEHEKISQTRIAD